MKKKDNTEQDAAREEVSHYLNTLTALAKDWGISYMYLYGWYQGKPVAKETFDKIKEGLKALRAGG